MASKLSKRIIVFVVCIVAVLSINKTTFALDRKTSFTLSHYIIGGMYERLGDIDRAIQEYKKALKLDYKNAVIHLSLASAYLKKNDTSKVIEELNLAIKFEPEAVEPHAILALLYFSQDKLVEAGKEYEKALQKASKLDPGNLNIYKKLGILYLQQKNLGAAENTFKLILNLSPDDVDTHFYLSNIYDELKKRDDAIKELKKVLELDPVYHQALNYLGYLFVEENRNLDEAEAMIKKAVEIEPDNGAYVDSLGWLYFKQGKIAKAVKELERAISLFEDPVIYDHLGDVYFKSKDFEKARLNWERSLKLDSEQEKVKKKLEGLK